MKPCQDAELTGLHNVQERNTFQFHPDVPPPDLRCDPFLIGMSEWLQDMGDRISTLRTRVHVIRFPVRPPEPTRRIATIDDL